MSNFTHLHAALKPWESTSPYLRLAAWGALIISAKLLAKENLGSQVATHLLQGHGMTTSWLMWTHIPGPNLDVFPMESLSRIRCVFLIKIRKSSKINNSNCQDILVERNSYPPENQYIPWTLMVGKWNSFQHGPFSGDMLFRGVSDVFAYLNWSHYTPISYFAARESITNYQPLHSNSPRWDNPTLWLTVP